MTWKNSSIGGREILKWILKGVRVWTGFIWLRIGTSGRFCEHSKKPSSYTKRREYLD
jgi:hypothetical protein